MSAPRKSCKYCLAGHPDDIGGDYSRKACEASWLRNEIAELEDYRDHECDEGTREWDEIRNRIAVYRRRLEQALDVGD